MVPVIRSMRRFKQALPLDACKEVLKNGRRGVLSVIGDDGYPYGVPINYVYDEKENALYFHGAKEGHKIDAIKKSGKVCFTVFDEDYKEDGDWAYYVKSVIVFGRAKVVEDEKRNPAHDSPHWPQVLPYRQRSGRHLGTHPRPRAGRAG